MARHRTRDRHLPARVYLRRGVYYFDSPVLKKWIPLGRDIAEALAKYGQLIGGNWRGRTVGDTIDRYRNEVLPLKRSAQTRTDQAKELQRLKAVFGDMLHDSVTTQHCYRYVDCRRDKEGNPVPTAARHEISLLGHVFSKAIRWGVATVNPVRAMEKASRNVRLRYVTDAEYEAVRALAGERLALAMDLARMTGQRRGDLLSLRREQLLEDGIVFRQSKTDAGVLIEWTDELRAAVARSKAMNPQIPGLYLLRTQGGKRYSARGFSAMWQRLMTKALKKQVIAERFTFHDLRRKAGSDKPTLEEARDLLGHRDTSTTRRFYKANLTRVKAGK
jgi:integrase